MKIGYLHIDVSQTGESGVTRYGRLMAAEGRKRPNLTVIESSIALTQDKQHNRTQVSQAAKQLSDADVIHLQYSKYIWGGGWNQLRYLRSFVKQYSRPVVATLHDVYPEFYPSYGLLSALNDRYQRQLHSKASWLKGAVNALLSTWYGYLADRQTLLWLSQSLANLFVSTEEEIQRIAHLIERDRISKISHFVEARASVVNRSQARQVLGLDRFKVITLQGFIYVNKGHQLLIEALPKLPSDAKVIFAGGAAVNNEDFLQNLLKLAEKLAVRDRLLVTGYLSEEDLIRYLMASDLAVCPFKLLSASGSLSTWISIARPILASNLPQIAEYNQIEPNAIHVFAPYTADALAEAILKILPICSQEEDPAVARLQKKLSMSVIFDEHLRHYCRCNNDRL